MYYFVDFGKNQHSFNSIIKTILSETRFIQMSVIQFKLRISRYIFIF